MLLILITYVYVLFLFLFYFFLFVILFSVSHVMLFLVSFGQHFGEHELGLKFNYFIFEFEGIK